MPDPGACQTLPSDPAGLAKRFGTAPEDTGGITFRRAAVADGDQIARLHHLCSQQQPGGFMHRLGRPFFRAYYRILLPDPNTIVLSAMDASGRILGFVAGCGDAQAEMDRLRQRRLTLLLSCLPRLLRRPALVHDLYARIRCLEGAQLDAWGGLSGSRISFWCWDPESSASRLSTVLLQHFLQYLKARGIKTVRFEVDRINRKVEITHRLMGARTVRTVQAPDGRERLVMEHILN
ncbi:hypothetical protein GETHPA_29570 [Geothrix rubra]|uniref:GNAT family N-acetyltransferase n=1 Tax=Geothrix rubra TaxID=2927977 RepID=A0ABQ5Q9R8_9BACT|nr:hypothetical protein [Geothrix rubra]GLH71423.1 hypothetical protein GETHPA_29570 [Geothrix rubra]